MGTPGQTRRSLSRLAAAILCLACAGWLKTGPTVRAVEGRPKAVVVQTRFDFGSVFAGEVLIHVFSIRNEGTAPLTLLDKARDTEGRAGTSTSQPHIAYARNTLTSLQGLTAIAVASTAPHPVPT